jgi:hypothetical protein
MTWMRNGQNNNLAHDVHTGALINQFSELAKRMQKVLECLMQWESEVEDRERRRNRQ